jgi:hypothetical protein
MYQYADGSSDEHISQLSYWKRDTPFPEQFVPVKLTATTPHERIPDYGPAGGSVTLYFVSEAFRSALEGLEPAGHRFFPIEVVLSSGRRLAAAYYLLRPNPQRIAFLQGPTGDICDPLGLATQCISAEELATVFVQSNNYPSMGSPLTYVRFVESVLRWNPRLTDAERVDRRKVEPLFPLLDWSTHSKPTISLFEICQTIPVIWQQGILGRHYWDAGGGFRFFSDELKKSIDESLLKWFRFSPLPLPTHDLSRYQDLRRYS